MSAVSAVKRGRRAARRLMVDACLVERVVPGAVDPRTGEPERAQVYSGVCKVQSFEAYETTPEAGNHLYALIRVQVHFPVEGYAPQVDDVVTVTAAFDENLVGRKFRIANRAPFKSLGTAYRVFGDEVVL